MNSMPSSVSISLPLSERININITLYVIGNRFAFLLFKHPINDCGKAAMRREELGGQNDESGYEIELDVNSKFNCNISLGHS